MSDNVQYKLSEAASQARYAEWAGSADPAALSSDLALARTLCEQAASKSPHLAASLLACIARLASAHDQRVFQHGQMLSKAAVMGIAMELIRCVTAEFQGCEDWEIRLENVANRFVGVIESATNTPEAPARIAS